MFDTKYLWAEIFNSVVINWYYKNFKCVCTKSVRKDRINEKVHSLAPSAESNMTSLFL